jgi:hypothetical protein
MKGHAIASFLLIIAATMMMLSSCSKPGKIISSFDASAKASKYSSDVIDKWMTLQIRLMRNATGIPNQAFSRHFVYSGIAALQSIAPGLPSDHAFWPKWNGLTGLPVIEHSVHYYYPANANAALASINRSFFPNTSAADKLAIDSLENALKTEFLTTQSSSAIELSAQFGKAVATAVFNWSETDGYKNASAYTAPVGPGLWVPTAPGFANAASPYWGNNRPVIENSLWNTQAKAPTAYSTEPESDFYGMVKEVYDASQNLTNDQKAMALFWRDVPGITSPGHWLSILQQTIKQVHTGLDKAALAYALTGAAINDALIACWQTKYHYNLVRPITYIRNVMGDTSWNSFITTPAHPEYCSAHASLSFAAAEMMQVLFGNINSFTDHSYDYLGFPPRTYSSFIAIGEEASISRLYAGIHYKASIKAGIEQGKAVVENIFDANTKTSHHSDEQN